MPLSSDHLSAPLLHDSASSDLESAILPSLQRDSSAASELASSVHFQDEIDKLHEAEFSATHLQGTSSLYTQDGLTDIHGRPSIKAETGGWKACRFILGNECCERLAYYGITTNIVTYLTTVLNQGNAIAAANINIWSGTCYITPFLGAFLADAYWGRYWTIAVFSPVYFVGMTLLILSATIPALNTLTCSDTATSSCKPSVGQLVVFYLALYLIALGAGGIKPCVLSFGADQFDDTDPAESKKKSSFFNWYYFSINIGAVIGSSVLVYIQDNYSWGWGFGIPVAAMAIAICSFLLGTPLYRHQTPGGSPLTRILQVLVSAFRKRKVMVSSGSNALYETTVSSIPGSRKLEHSNELLCLDKAATVTMESPPGSSPWKLCTVTQVEEFKMIIRILPIWATTIIFESIYAQIFTLFVEQGSTMDTSLGSYFNIPPASLSTFNTLSVMIWVPIYDFLLVPITQRFTGNHRGFTEIQRIGIGLIIATMSMVAAALTEMKRLEIARENDLLDDTDTPVPMSIFWQIPQYFLVGAAEVFTVIGELEFFYNQSPDGTRSLCTALGLATVAIGSYLSSLILIIVTAITTRGGSPGWIPDNLNIGHVDYFFWLLAGLSLLNFFAYLACAHLYTYKKISHNASKEK